MGMGYAACTATTISAEKLRAFLPDEFAEFEQIVEKLRNQFDFDFEQFAEQFQFSGIFVSLEVACSRSGIHEHDEEFCEAGQQLLTAYILLQTAFAQKTAVNGTGLELDLGYHNQTDCGDRYDEVNGVFWSVGGYWQLTPAAEAFKDQLELQEVFYVTYG